MMIPTLNLKHPVAIVFRTQYELNLFEIECKCEGLYSKRDFLTLIGSFAESQITIATNKYHAIVAFVKGVAGWENREL